YSCRRCGNVPFGQYGDDPGDGEGRGHLREHHGPLPLDAGDRRLLPGAPERGFRPASDADERVEVLSLASGDVYQRGSGVAGQRGFSAARGGGGRAEGETGGGGEGDSGADRTRPRFRYQADA